MNGATIKVNVVRLRVCCSVFIYFSFIHLRCESILPWLYGDCKVGFLVPGHPAQFATLLRAKVFVARWGGCRRAAYATVCLERVGCCLGGGGLPWPGIAWRAPWGVRGYGAAFNA
jgi:hypothetical protein